MTYLKIFFSAEDSGARHVLSTVLPRLWPCTFVLLSRPRLLPRKHSPSHAPVKSSAGAFKRRVTNALQARMNWCVPPLAAATNAHLQCAVPAAGPRNPFIHLPSPQANNRRCTDGGVTKELSRSLPYMCRLK